ncbi:hypothetical protein ILUMI_16454, partial [Ignelater luminosus]
MIEKFDEIYLIKNSAMKLLCKRKLLDLKMQENKNPTDFFNKFEKQLNELKNSEETVSEIDKLYYLLLALPETLSHIVDIVDALPQKDRSVEYVKSKLILEFQKRNNNKDSVNNDTQTFSTNVSKSIKNFNTQNFNYKQQQTKYYNSINCHYDQPSTSRYQDKPNNTVQRCFKCNRPGHIQRYCRSNPNWRNGYSRNPSRNNLTRVAGNSIVEDGAKAESTSNSFNVEVMSAETNTKQKAYTVEENDIKWLLLNKIGNIDVYFNVSNKLIKTKIKNVYYVPSMSQNLLSVSCIVNQNKSVIFKNDRAKIYNCEEELIAVATKLNKLFKLDGKVRGSEITSCGSSAEISKKEKWHRILGHANFQDLKHLCQLQLAEGLPYKIENDFLKCEINVNGPISPTGYKGERYFVCFVDDFSKTAVVYCIKYKSEVFNRFVEYIKLMQNQTGKKIKEIHCYNGREYINKDFFRLAKAEGIYLRTGPPHTHELNGVAERYNRTIMNLARRLLSEAKIDKSYWPECVYTAAYIGNGLLANTRIRKTPYEIFFNKKPDVSNLHLYGSTAFVRIPEKCRSSKLDSKAVK